MVPADQYNRSVSDDASSGKSQFTVGERFRSHNKFNNLHVPITLARCDALPDIQTGEPIKISLVAKLVYGSISLHEGKSGECFASLATMAAEVSTSVDTVGRALDVLVRVGLVRRRRRRNLTAVCELIWHPVLTDSLKKQDSAELRSLNNNQADQDSAGLRIRTPQDCVQDSAGLRNPYKEEKIQKEIQVKESSSSSGSPDGSKLSNEEKEEEDSLLLQNFLRDWMRALHPHRDFPLPPMIVIRSIRRATFGWTDEQRMEGYRQNALRRMPNPNAPPNGYGYFETVIKNFYEESNGVPPELPIPKQLEELPEYSDCRAGGGPPKPVACAYCKGSGRLSEGGAYCNMCDRGPELKKRNAEESAIRQAHEAEKVKRSQQNDEWIALGKHQSSDIRRQMDFGDLGGAFFAATISERDEILQEIREGKHALVVPRLQMAMTEPLVTRSSATAA